MSNIFEIPIIWNEKPSISNKIPGISVEMPGISNQDFWNTWVFADLAGNTKYFAQDFEKLGISMIN